MRAPRLIELIGVPGSGKTTVTDLLCRELETVNLVPLTVPEAGRAMARRSWLGAFIPAESKPWGDRLAWKLFEFERLVRGLGFLLVRPGFAVRLIAFQLRRPRSARGGRRVVHWWIRAAGARSLLLARCLGNEIVLLDEGLCHRVVQLFSSADEVPDQEVITRYVRDLPFPDVLIHVVAPVDVSYSRVMNRGVWERLEDEDPARVRTFLSSAAVAISYLLDTEKARNSRVLDVDNSGQAPSGLDILGRLRSEGVLA